MLNKKRKKKKLNNIKSQSKLIKKNDFLRHQHEKQINKNIN